MAIEVFPHPQDRTDSCPAELHLWTASPHYFLSETGSGYVAKLSRLDLTLGSFCLSLSESQLGPGPPTLQEGLLKEKNRTVRSLAFRTSGNEASLSPPPPVPLP